MIPCVCEVIGIYSMFVSSLTPGGASTIPFGPALEKNGGIATSLPLLLNCLILYRVSFFARGRETPFIPVN